MISDAHVHLDERLERILIKDKISAIISCANPSECEVAMALCNTYPFLSYSCGVHPWFVESMPLDRMMPYLKQAQIIGEIGMDSIWCKQDRAMQKHVFQQQLAYASKHKKPVILHTKGEEKEVADSIRKYPNTCLVHWYSCMQYVSLYKDLHCYFSIGPDGLTNESVQEVVRQIDLQYLLIESDGIAAIEWAVGCIKEDEYQSTLYKSLVYIANAKQKSIEEVKVQVNKNYQTFTQTGRV